MLDPTNLLPNSPAGQAPTPDQGRHAHSASPKVLSEAEGLRDPIKLRHALLAGRTAPSSQAPSRFARGTNGWMNDLAPLAG